MAEPIANPSGFGRKPTYGPGTTREEIDRRQAAKLTASRNGELRDGVVEPYLTAKKSTT